jgi:diguanylate cyclase (GGDEF) domain
MSFGIVLANSLSLSLLLGLIVVSFVRREVKAAKALCLSSVLAFTWSIGSFIEALASSFEAKLFWRNFEQFGTFYIPVAVLWFGLAYANVADKRRRTIIASALFALQSLPVALIWADRSLHLMRRSTELVPTESGLMVIGVSQTMAGMIAVSINYVISCAGVALLIAYALRQSPAPRKAALSVAAGMALPTLFSALKNTFGQTSFEGLPASAAFAVGGFIMLAGVRRFGLLGLGSIARDRAFEVIDEGILVSDLQGQLVDMNPAARRILCQRLGLPADAGHELVGRRLREAIGSAQSALGEGGGMILELPLDGLSAFVSLRVYPLASGGSKVGYSGVIRDITGEILRMSDLKLRAERDPLSGAYNKAAFAGIVSELVSKPSAYGFLVVFDIDHFKACNDTMGHLAGDAVIRGVAERCRESLREGDLLGRVGGDEFALFLSVARRGDASALAERIRAAVSSEPFDHSGLQISVTISMGAAMCSGEGEEYERLFARADAALYESKKAGRDKLEFAPDVPATAGAPLTSYS